MAKFDLGAFAQTLRTVPDSGTAERMQIEYIDIDLLDGSPDNFYELRGIDELAGDIETVGLQQPLLVSPGDGGHYTVLSGHRRRAALQMLVKAGRDDLRMVPCIRSAPGSPALDKLRLLYANAHTRVLTPAELAKQAALAEDTIYQLKEEGHEFPGRMRELVAEVCGIKSSKLGRLKKIDRHLAPCYKPLWESGQLPEDTADALSSLPKNAQERIKRVCPKKTPNADAIRKIRAKLDAGRDYVTIPFACPDGSVCTHSDKFFRHDLICCSWDACSGQKCCVECRAGGAHDPGGGSYNAACTEMCAKARKIYEQAKADKDDRDAREKSRARSKAVKKAMADAARIVRAADSAGVADNVMLAGAYGGMRLSELRKIAAGDIPENTTTYALGEIIPYSVKSLVDVAAKLHCSTDYILGLSDAIPSHTLPEPGQLVLGCWMPGGTIPGHDCDGLVILDVGGPMDPGCTMRTSAYYYGGAWYIDREHRTKVDDIPILAWLEVPAWERAEKEEAT